MKIFDLSHTISKDMTIYPGTKAPEIAISFSNEKDGYQETRISLDSHTGTHMDAPGHLIPHGKMLDDYSIEDFMGSAYVLDLTNITSDFIEIQHIEKYHSILQALDYCILKTNWSKYWGTQAYYETYPVLSIEAATWLTQFKLKGIGIDTISFDAIDPINEFPIHHIFLEKEILLIENLTHLAFLPSTKFIFSSMPLKYKSSDGSPVRAFGIPIIL